MAPAFRTGLLFCAALQAHRHHLLVGRFTCEHLARGLVDDEGVGRHHAPDNGFAQPPGRADHGLIALAGNRIGREQYTGTLCRHKPLDDDGDLMRPILQGGYQAFGLGVGLHTLILPRSVDRVDGLAYLLVGVYVQHCLELAGKGSLGRILTHRRGAHSKGGRSACSTQTVQIDLDLHPGFRCQLVSGKGAG